MLKGLMVTYEPHRMPPTYMADCAVMTHAVLRQLEGYGGIMLRKKKARLKARRGGNAVGPDGLPLEGGEDQLDVLGGGGADGDDDAAAQMEEICVDFDHELYKFAGQKEIISRYVNLLTHFDTMAPQVGPRSLATRASPPTA